MSWEWAIGALVIAAASFVMGLAGFGIGLVSLAFLPYVMSPVTAVIVTIIYALLFSIVVLVPLRADVEMAGMWILLVGTVLAAPLGIWALATLSVSTLNPRQLLFASGVVLLVRG